MITYALTLLIPLSQTPANPSSPSDLPLELAGPYGFLVVIFSCAFWGLREWRKGRQEDVASAKARAEAAEAKVEALENKSENEASLLNTKIENLQNDIRDLKDHHYRDLENATAKYYATRQMLLALGVPKEEIP